MVEFLSTTNRMVDREVNLPKMVSSGNRKRRNDILSFPLQPSYFFITLFAVTKKKVVDQEVNPPKMEERHLVVPLATELFLYYAFCSNGNKGG